MSVEERLRDSLAAFDDVEPAPDLFRRVERSVAADRVRRRRIVRWMAAVALALTVAVVAIALGADRGLDGSISIPGWAMVAMEAVLLAGVVVSFGPLIRRFGALFVDDVFFDGGIGRAFLRLLDVAYYLVFVGYVILTVPVAELGGPQNLEAMLDRGADRFGGLLLLMGIMHAVTITALPLIGLIHTSTVREQRRADVEGAPPSTSEAAFAERVVRIVLWSAGGLVLLAMSALFLDIVLSILLGFDG